MSSVNHNPKPQLQKKGRGIPLRGCCRSLSFTSLEPHYTEFQNIQNHKNPEIGKWGGGHWSTQITNAEEREKLVTLFIYLFLSSSRLNFEGKAPKNVKFGIPSKSKGEENPKS